MKKIILIMTMVLALSITGCFGSSKSKLKELPSLIKTTITYEQAYEIVQQSEKLPLTRRSRILYQDFETIDPAVNYFLNRYESVTVKYAIVTESETIETTFEIRGEVFLNAIQNNIVSITASMPSIKYLFVSTQQIEQLESENQEWKNSAAALIAPFSNKYRYGTTIDHFGFEIKDFTSAAGGMSTTETSNEFSFSATDNRLIKWQFEFFVKNESTSGTKLIEKTIEITFDWKLKE